MQENSTAPSVMTNSSSKGATTAAPLSRSVASAAARAGKLIFEMRKEIISQSTHYERGIYCSSRDLMLAAFCNSEESLRTHTVERQLNMLLDLVSLGAKLHTGYPQDRYDAPCVVLLSIDALAAENSKLLVALDPALTTDVLLERRKEIAQAAYTEVTPLRNESDREELLNILNGRVERDVVGAPGSSGGKRKRDRNNAFDPLKLAKERSRAVAKARAMDAARLLASSPQNHFYVVVDCEWHEHHPNGLLEVGWCIYVDYARRPKPVDDIRVASLAQILNASKECNQSWQQNKNKHHIEQENNDHDGDGSVGRSEYDRIRYGARESSRVDECGRVRVRQPTRKLYKRQSVHVRQPVEDENCFVVRHAVIANTERLFNGKYVPNQKQNFAFGDSWLLSLEGTREAFMQDIERCRRFYGEPVLVAHGGDKRDFEFLGQACSAILPVGSFIDTAAVYRIAREREPQQNVEQQIANTGGSTVPTKLASILDYFGIQKTLLHNAGNDAYCTALALRAIANKL